MSVIFLLIPLSIVIAACFLGAFIWAVRTGQYEDTLTPSMRVLLDDAALKPSDRALSPVKTNAKNFPHSNHS
jgi:cbb3-type cytochrome oxidase maturation protein